MHMMAAGLAEAVRDAGVEIRYLPPEALAALVQRETDYWGKLIRAKNIRAD